MMGRLDSGFWGPSATLPDEPPIEGEEREPQMTAWRRRREQDKRAAAAVLALKQGGVKPKEER